MLLTRPETDGLSAIGLGPIGSAAGRALQEYLAGRLANRGGRRGYRCGQLPGLLSQTFAASNCWYWVMYTALCTYGACSLSCSGEVIG